MSISDNFYLGRHYHLEGGEILEQPLHYDPDDLTTHGVVVGMTGSGKTGLCIDLLEEAALAGIPALLVDPKGDLTNLLLHFPGLTPAEFEPWIDPDQARRDGKSVPQAAAETAELWSSGLADWDLSAAQVLDVRQAVEYKIYTPGSQTGQPVNILTALSAPVGDWQEAPDRFRDRITTTTTALLGLVDVDADPVKSREHILLANLLEHAWQAEQDLDLPELVRQVQNPPFERLGAMEVEQFFPEQDRFELAMALNNLLAAPAFEAWTVGDALDVEAMLWTPDGKPRQTVFYLAHLGDSERMFFVTLLLGALDAWMRGQSGSSKLRALFYMDEVFGYLPPTAVPPSKPTFLRLLKQARAFGLGLLLSTQNPVDLDYKALSNAGTWFVGRLQTERDKERLLDGLESAAAGKGGFSRKEADQTLGRLKKRVFLLHNVHQDAPQVFYTRWAMAYLKGPLSLPQIAAVNALVGVEGQALAPAAMGAADPQLAAARPSVPQVAAERFLVPAAEAEAEGTGGLLYRPALLAQATVRFVDHKLGIDSRQQRAALDPDPDERGMVRWPEVEVEPLARESLREQPVGRPQYEDLAAPLNDDKLLRQLKKDFDDYLYGQAELHLRTNPELDLVAPPEETEEDFQRRCLEAATERRDEEAEELRDEYQKKIENLREKLSREERELAEDEADLSSRRMEELATHAENLLGFLGGSRSRRRVSTSLTKRRMTTKAKADVEESEEVIEEFRRQLEELEEELLEELEELDEKWARLGEERGEKVLTPRRKDIQLDLFGVLWLPYRPREGKEPTTAFDPALLD